MKSNSSLTWSIWKYRGPLFSKFYKVYDRGSLRNPFEKRRKLTPNETNLIKLESQPSC